MTEVIIFSKPNCHLCHVVHRIATRLRGEMTFNLQLVDISGDPEAIRQYGMRIPIVLIDQVEYFSGKVTERELRQAIKSARWRRPISRILARLGVQRG